MRTNYHTHTSRCGHAALVPDAQYVEQAIESGYKVLGFSDHTPWCYTNGFENPTVRMSLSMLPDYLESIRGLRRKYGDQIEIFVGLECEYFPDFMDWLRQTRAEVDYLILGNHFGRSEYPGSTRFFEASRPEELKEYADETIAGMRTGLYSYLAHPDTVFSHYPVFDEAAQECASRLCAAAKELDLPLEYNLYGVDKRERQAFRGLGYPAADFWQMAAEFGCTAIVGVDAHKPEHLAKTERYDAAREYLNGLGMNVLERLSFR